MSLLLTTPKAFVRRHLLDRLPGAQPRNPLQGKRILVTGASSGIGEATALLCAERGATVLLVARRADALERVRDEIAAFGGTAYAHPCDLTDGDAVDALVRDVVDRHGGVDMLVNNAGRSIRRSIRLSYDRMHDVERTMAVNFFGPVRLLLGLLPGMAERGDGHVVNVLTWGVQVKAPKFSAYIASKTALDTWSRIAGRELYADGVTFTNVRMALVRTDMIGPTEAYAKLPALSPEQAGARIVRALEDRPLTVNVLAGSLGEVFNLVAPRLSDAVFSAVDRRFPDSAAARAHAEESGSPARGRRVAG
ncbi:SDR family NAD(P)-dependent oxidoreductase [Nocardioides iriomotensis]|uniref:SDR family NAD(P)-dependent oxidoreductase n=1 Tax=Nocardioides iriomotensis TaxID=715784 RepID=UPI001F116474|nr:SDR family NAD(P)-dependent oxidoreductase [Nocardioides iriomotensis]